MTDTYTPDEEQVREQYTQEQPPQIGTVAEKHAEFDRFIARIKAEALREASRGFALSPHVNYPGTAVHEELARRADRIEKEARDG